MKKTQRILTIATLMMLLLGAGVSLVSAVAIGDPYSIAGYNAGWFIIGIGIAIGVIVVVGKSMGTFGGKAIKVTILPILGMLVIGGAMVGVQVDVTTASITSPGWKITATADVTSLNYIGYLQDNPQWDDDENLYTIPLDVDSSANGRLNESITALNFTVDPIAGGRLTTATATIYMSSDYDIKYGGEEVFDKTGNYFDVNWTTSSGTNSYEDTIDMQITETGWALCTWEFNNNTAGNWVTELNAIGDTLTWYVTFWDDLGFHETITVTAMVVEYA